MLDRFSITRLRCRISTSGVHRPRDAGSGLPGPSEFATSVSLTAMPDLIMRDGASQSTIVVTANDPQGAPIRSLQMRLDMLVNGAVQDFGTLSTRTLFTGADGRATAHLHRSAGARVGALASSPTASRSSSRRSGRTAQDATHTTADIRLVPPITTDRPDAPVAFFTYAPSTRHHDGANGRLQRQRLVTR